MHAMPYRGDPASWLGDVARTDPDRLLIETSAGRRLAYGQFAALSGRLAAALAARGIEPGDRVVAQVEKSPEAAALYMACLYLGAVFVPLNTAYTCSELEYFLEDAQPSLIVVAPRLVEAVRAMSGAAVETMDVDGNGSLSAAAQRLEPHARADIDSAALAALLYTSGTTGRSKGAMLTRGNLASNAQTLARAWRFTRDDVLLHALPIFHVHGLFVAINTVLAAGCSMLFLPKFDVEEVLRLLSRATVLMGVPTFYTRLLNDERLSRETTRNVRLFVSGSAPLLPETHRAFRDRTGHAILERYGMSETLMNASNPYDGERVPGSVGPPLAGVEIRIADPRTAQILAGPQAVGTIEVRGPNVFRGYWRMPEKTAEAFREDGFFLTGDLGRIDERSYVHIVGRDKDMIITGGYNVYPIEIEAQIDALPGVVESAVIGVPHPDFGEGVTALVVADENAGVDERAVVDALETRLANYKRPKRVLFVDELPRNALGKVQKSVLRERYRDLYAGT